MCCIINYETDVLEMVVDSQKSSLYFRPKVYIGIIPTWIMSARIHTVLVFAYDQNL